MSGGDLALAAEVFHRYDADGSGRLDRDELLAALRDLGGQGRTSALRRHPTNSTGRPPDPLPNMLSP